MNITGFEIYSIKFKSFRNNSIKILVVKNSTSSTFLISFSYLICGTPRYGQCPWHLQLGIPT